MLAGRRGALRPSRPGRRPIPALAALVLTLGLSACGESPERFRGRAADPSPAPNLVGVNWDGQPFQLDDVQGRIAMVFFGYTYCPDVCPFTLAKMQQIYGTLGDRAEDLAVVFVSVDPHRDTLDKLSSYVPNFDPRFYGLQLTVDELDALKDTFFDLEVQYGQPKDGPGTDSFYYVDHTGTYFLLDRDGQLRVTHPPNAEVEDLIADVETLLAG